MRALHVLLSASQRWWRPDDTPQLPVSRLVAEASAIAASSDDPTVKAIARHAEGMYLIATSGLPPAIAVFEEAARHGRDSTDPYALIDALSELGHHLAGQDLPRTLRLLTEAHRLVDALDQRELAVLVRAGRISGFIGVAHFDAERFDEGEEWLRRSLTQLEAAGIVDQFLMISNYLGQLLIAAGRHDEGRAVLARAIDRTPRESHASMHLGYNLGLLGKLELEAGRPAVAEPLIRDGWRHLADTQHASVRPILRNYLAELLIHPGYGQRDLDAADTLLTETVADTRRTGFRRSEINALALHAQVRAELGDLDRAAALAGEAATRVRAAGALPALRTEEVFLVHHDVLRRQQHDREADDALRLAYTVLMDKAATIHDPARRAVFLTRVPVSAAIVAAHDRHAAPA